MVKTIVVKTIVVETIVVKTIGGPIFRRIFRRIVHGGCLFFCFGHFHGGSTQGTYNQFKPTVLQQFPSVSRCRHRNRRQCLHGQHWHWRKEKGKEKGGGREGKRGKEREREGRE